MDRDKFQTPIATSSTRRTSSSTTTRSSSTRATSTMPTTTMGRLPVLLRSLFFFERRSLAPFMLFLRAQPAAKHPSDLVNIDLKRQIFFLINRPCVFHQTDEQTKQIELYASLFKKKIFIGLLGISCFKKTFDHIKQSILASLPDSVAILLRNNSAIFMEQLIKIV